MGKNTYTPGDLIFGKMKGYPPWPARVTAVAGKDRYKVYFYGTHETGTLKSEGMWIYDPKNKAKFTPKKKKPKGYDEGVDQIENTPEIAAVEGLEEEAGAAAGKAGAVEQPVPKDTPKTRKAGKRKATEMSTPKAPAKKVAKTLVGAAKSENNSEKEENFSHFGPGRAKKTEMLGDFDSMSAAEASDEPEEDTKSIMTEKKKFLHDMDDCKFKYVKEESSSEEKFEDDLDPLSPNTSTGMKVEKDQDKAEEDRKSIKTENNKFLDDMDASKFNSVEEESSSEDKSEDDFDTNDSDSNGNKPASELKMPPRLLRVALQSEKAGLSEYEKIRDGNIMERKERLATLRADFSDFKKDSGIGAKKLAAPKRKREDSDSDGDWHPKWQHKSKPKPQKCSECPAVVQNIDLHMKECHTGELMTCTKCSYRSRRKAVIELHYRKVHTDLDIETCHVCGQRFKGLKKHLQRTKCGTGKRAEATIPCPIGCSKMFTLKDSVYRHIEQVHQQNKKKICPFCEYKTYSKFNLNLHVTKMHEGKKMEKQQCPYCEKTPYVLDYHMKIYHNDKC